MAIKTGKELYYLLCVYAGESLEARARVAQMVARTAFEYPTHKKSLISYAKTIDCVTIEIFIRVHFCLLSKETHLMYRHLKTIIIILCHSTSHTLIFYDADYMAVLRVRFERFDCGIDLATCTVAVYIRWDIKFIFSVCMKVTHRLAESLFYNQPLS